MSPLVLVPLDPVLAPRVSGWAPTDAEALAWCSAERAPVPPEQVVAWGRADGVEAHLAVQEGVPVAYGELWLDDDEVELARLLVDPARRGRGVGRALVHALVAQVGGRAPLVCLRVRPDNAAALRCYAAAGLVRVDPAREAEWNTGQPLAYAWMVLP